MAAASLALLLASAWGSRAAGEGDIFTPRPVSQGHSLQQLELAGNLSLLENCSNLLKWKLLMGMSGVGVLR